jgi:SMF family protein
VLKFYKKRPEKEKIKMVIDAINLYQETINYELMWASIQNSNLKKVDELKNSQLPLNIQDVRADIENFFKDLPKNFSIITNESYQYPALLKETYIKKLYFKGDISLLEAPKKISIVGARKATDNGKARARNLAKILTEKGFVIVSGLAAGIDTEAMQSTIKHSGHLIGVIGTPINEYYPKENKSLQDEVAQKHLLLSHVPFFKYSKQPFATKKFYFPERNAVMAAVSDATVIVEASETSGTLTQARACMEMGRKLFILNSCFENGLKWPHTYEDRGAIRVSSIDDILRYF